MRCKTYLVTGGAGFIGSNFIKYILQKYDDVSIVNLDKLTYAGNLENLEDIVDNSRYSFIKGNITNEAVFRGSPYSFGSFDVIINFAAESHVDRSIIDCSPFIKTNIVGTQVLLQAVKYNRVKLYIQVSTDEVYGSIESGKFTEKSSLLPNNLYSASKAAADCLCRAYYRTYNLPIIITRSSNNYGPFQFCEKLIPHVITNALKDKEIPLYGDGLNIRDWLYVEDHCRALDLIIQQGKCGETYNIGGNCEKTNLEVVKQILELMKKSHSLITFVVDRLGHDRRYALDTTKISRELDWKPCISFEEGLKKTIKWYKALYGEN